MQHLFRVVTFLMICGIPIATRAVPALNFLIDGNTFTTPFEIKNVSTAGELVLRFQLDLTGALDSDGYSLVFDTADGGVPNTTLGNAFTPVGGTEISTGLIGTASDNNPPDGFPLLDISFLDFDPGESFRWEIDVDCTADPVVSGCAPVYGNELIGASAIVDFSDGQRIFGQLEAVAGNPDASSFSVHGITHTPSVPEPSSGLLLLVGLLAVGRHLRLSGRRYG